MMACVRCASVVSATSQAYRRRLRARNAAPDASNSSVDGSGTDDRSPNRPWSSTLPGPGMPAVKNRSSGNAPWAPLPNNNPHSPLDHDRLALRVVQCPGKGTCGRIERVDGAVAEVSYQEITTELTEGTGGQRQAPGRVEWASRDQSSEQIAVCIEHIDEAVTRTGDVIMPSCVLLRVCDVEIMHHQRRPPPRC